MNKLSSIRAVILDWAGTTVDHGSLAPAKAFVEVFRRQGIEITTEEARGPMGKSKRDHIVSITVLPRIAELWRERHGSVPSETQISAMYDDFIPIQKELLTIHSDVIPGVPEAVRKLLDRGIQVGSTTGYSRELMDIVMPIAAKQGYSPDFVICADDVPAGRPAPWMNFAAAQKFGVYPMNSILIVDDTPIGIQAGLNAGTVTAAVMRTGNSLGLSVRDVERLPATELDLRMKAIHREFVTAGADYVVESVADIPSLIE